MPKTEGRPGILVCPCGCGQEVQQPRGWGDTPFAHNESGQKVLLATPSCRYRYQFGGVQLKLGLGDERGAP